MPDSSGPGLGLFRRQREVRIFDDAENIAEGIENRGYANPLTHFLNRGSLGRPERNQPGERRFCIGDAPISNGTTLPARRAGSIRIESQFVAGHVESDVKRLVEVRREAQHFRVP